MVGDPRAHGSLRADEPAYEADRRALGIATLSTIATSQTASAVAAGTALPSALVDGFTAAFVAGVAVSGLGILVALTLIRSDELEQAPQAVEPVLDLAA